jgi:hypothetical protein
MNLSLLIFLVSLVILIIIFKLYNLSIYKSINTSKTFNKSRTYYKCTDKHNPPSKNILTTLGYHHQNPLTLEQQPNLFIPCTYSNAERELGWTPAEMITHSNVFMIQGCDKIAAKDTLWQLLVARFAREGASRIMPETYITNDTKDMELFYSGMKMEESYILKKNMQRKEGLIVIRGMMPSQIKNVIKQGDYLLIQEYIGNPLVINSRKINLRIYVSIICEPEGDSRINGYLYKHGKCIYTNKPYNPETVEDVESQITSINLDLDIYKYNPETTDELSEYLTHSRYSRIRNKIQTKLSQVMDAVRDNICSREGFKGQKQFQLFGVDIMLDANLEPWILEFNKGPDMEYKTEKDEQMKKQLYQDLFCLVGLDTNCLTEITNWHEL